MLHQLRVIAEALPWALPSVVVGALLGLVSLPVGRRRSRADRIGLALLLWCLTVALVVTMSPMKYNYFGAHTLECNFSMWKPLPRSYWFSEGSRPPNLWMLFVAGVGVMLLDGFWKRLAGTLALFALPVGIEYVQYYFPQLKRSCSSQDIVDNWTGLTFGLIVGAVLALLVAAYRWVARASEERRERRRAAMAARGGPDEGRLPLNGIDNGGQYSDFDDFDDTPTSSRWYEDEPTRSPYASADEHGDGYHDDHTQVMPRGEDSTRAFDERPHPTDPDDPDSTQIIPRHDR